MVGTLQTYIHIVGTCHYVDGFCWFPCVVLSSLYCGTQITFLSRPWVDCIIGYREQGRDLVFVMYAIIVINS